MPPARPPSAARRVLGITVLVVAGEAAFGLPFHVARFFRPTLLAGLGIDNTELGGLFAAYGVVAALCYFPGGLLADRFPARRLMCASLALTAACGLFLATLPGPRALIVVHAAFGVTTILLFWAALIRATRSWAGAGRQGAAFGALEGGRGLFAAVLASLAYLAFRAAFVGDPATASPDERLLALQRVYLVYTAATFVAAALVWSIVPDDRDAGPGERPGLRRVGRVLREPVIWSQAVIVLCAYCAYKGIDNYGLYLMTAYAMDEVEAASAMVMTAWIRPLAALGAGLLADQLRPSRVALLCFAALALGHGALALLQPASAPYALVWADLALTCAAAFGLRGVYFALMDEARVPPTMTGTAVGLISMIGFLPEIFIAPLTGWLLDRRPGLVGHQHVFLLLGAAALLGLICCLLLRRGIAAGRGQ